MQALIINELKELVLLKALSKIILNVLNPSSLQEYNANKVF